MHISSSILALCQQLTTARCTGLLTCEETRTMRPSLRILLLLLATSSPAWGQRADENVVTDAEDAFGSNVGGQAFGLYTPSSVRGFSPTVAGNVRLEGLYFDRQAELTSRLVEGNRVRVGPSALSYAFPAPSGIADYRLRRPGPASLLSIVGQADSFGAALLELDAQMPLVADRLGVAAGVGVYRNDYAAANTADVLSTAAVLRWSPAPGTELIPFWSRIRITDEEVQPIYVGPADRLPERVEARRFIGQSWADDEVARHNFGWLGTTAARGVDLRGGIFRSVNKPTESHSLFHSADRLGEPARRRVIADPPSRSASTSGELVAGKRIDIGRVASRLQLSLRGREQRRTYGGGASAELPVAPYGARAPVDRIAFAFGPLTRDRVSQRSAGLTWHASLPDVGKLNLGVQRADYQKTVIEPDRRLPESSTKAWLYNAAGSIDVAAGLSLYAATSRGLEESPVAPQTAINRNEAPPAIRPRQVEAGIEWRPGPEVSLVAGAFRIDKPYYGLDGTNLFRRLGEVRHQGFELSLLLQPAAGVDVVLGGVLIEAELSGEEVRSGAIGREPIAIAERNLLASLNWAPQHLPRVSFDVTIEHSGPQFGDVGNRIELPSRTIVDAGLRYRLGRGTWRLAVTNLLDAGGWEVVGHRSYTVHEPRRLLLRYAVDIGE
jgi:iron complex outermembrane receptor protein